MPDKKSKPQENPKAGSASAKNRVGIKTTIMLIGLVFLGLIFLPTSFLLLVGLIPSWVAVFIGAITRGTRPATVVAMNLAGCMPFVMKLWSQGHTFENAVYIVSNTQVITIIYTAAFFGYLIDWVVTGLVASYLYQKGRARMRVIKSRQEELIEAWSKDVAGRFEDEMSEEELSEYTKIINLKQ
ncbi:MAG: hypothetical protein GC137_08465 [Alphaproteobacteria bacterium]|nr:hypothetical protein [Alphaproteobacteria bacterium]